jgi:hypothetical protein
MPAPLAAPAGGMPKLCVKTLNGCRVARVGAGIFIGKISAPRPQYAAEANPRYMSSLYAGVKTPGGPGGMHLRGSLFLSEEVGLHLQVKAGNGFFAGVGLVFRGWF